MISTRTEQEYRALIRGWRIRLKEQGMYPGHHEISRIIDEMEAEVPDYIPQKFKVGKGGDQLPRETIGH